MTGQLTEKYRPSKFDDLLGQDGVAESVRNILDKGTARAFLFEGPSGTGKTTLGRMIAHHLKADARNVLEFDAASHSGVDAIKEMMAPLRMVPMGTNKARVVIIDEVHAISKAAWEAMLKTIEEPPPHTLFVLCTTESGKVPKTIRTRCAGYTLKPVDDDIILDFIREVSKAEGFNLSDDVLDLIATGANGSPRQALNNLSKCSACKNRKEAVSVLKLATEAPEAVELAKLLASGGGANWPKVAAKLESLKDENAEGVRIVVASYVAAVLRKTKGPEKAAALAVVLDAFADPFPDSMKYHLVVAASRACLSE